MMRHGQAENNEQQLLNYKVDKSDQYPITEQGKKKVAATIKELKKLGITKHVKFVNRYLSLQELINYVGACDYYVTPYLDPQQSASGALAYAIGAGKTCISTPYPYAKEMLSRGRGTLVPFKDSGAIAKAVIDLELNPDKKQDIEEKAYEMGRTMTWNSVAHQYYHLFHFAL